MPPTAHPDSPYSKNAAVDCCRNQDTFQLHAKAFKPGRAHETAHTTAASVFDRSMQSNVVSCHL